MGTPRWRKAYAVGSPRCQLIESDPFGGLIGEVCGTFVPNAMIQVMTVAAIVYGSPAFGACGKTAYPKSWLYWNRRRGLS